MRTNKDFTDRIIISSKLSVSDTNLTTIGLETREKTAEISIRLTKHVFRLYYSVFLLLALQNLLNLILYLTPTF